MYLLKGTSQVKVFSYKHAKCAYTCVGISKALGNDKAGT